MIALNENLVVAILAWHTPLVSAGIASGTGGDNTGYNSSRKHFRRAEKCRPLPSAAPLCFCKILHFKWLIKFELLILISFVVTPSIILY
jgi:hypothetical protein